jgi:dephospho-CoA kinase
MADRYRRPIAVAITGGIGAGKSEALKAFERRGAAVTSSDAIVHDLFREDDEVRSALRERWGDGVFTAGGEVDRGAIARIVFADEAELAWLEGLLHPRVEVAQMAWREALAREPSPPALCVTEIPLLYEIGAETRFDKTVAISADSTLRATRTTVRADGRERRLISDEEKLRRADFAYLNEGSLDALDAFVGSVVEQLEADATASMSEQRR